MNIVEFPGLGGLKLTINRVAFEVFGLPIYWYGIIIALAFLAAVLLAVRDSKKFGIDPDRILDMVLIAAPSAIVCARLYYVIFTWDMFRDNPIDIINTRKGGLAIYGGIIGALLATWIYCKVKKIAFLKIFDFAAPFIALGQGIGRWGNFVNQEAFGSATTLPWRMTSETVREYLAGAGVSSTDLAGRIGVHPTFFYECIVDLGIFFFLMWFRHRKKADGEIFFLYMMLYGIGRALIEGLRTDSLMLGMGDIRVSQLLATIFAIVFLVLFILFRRRHTDAVEEEEVVIGTSSYGSVLTRLKEQAEAEAQTAESQKTEPQMEEVPAKEMPDGADAGEGNEPGVPGANGTAAGETESNETKDQENSEDK